MMLRLYRRGEKKKMRLIGACLGFDQAGAGTHDGCYLLDQPDQGRLSESPLPMASSISSH